MKSPEAVALGKKSAEARRKKLGKKKFIEAMRNLARKRKTKKTA